MVPSQGHTPRSCPTKGAALKLELGGQKRDGPGVHQVTVYGAGRNRTYVALRQLFYRQLAVPSASTPLSGRQDSNLHGDLVLLVSKTRGLPSTHLHPGMQSVGVEPTSTAFQTVACVTLLAQTALSSMRTAEAPVGFSTRTVNQQTCVSSTNHDGCRTCTHLG